MSLFLRPVKQKRPVRLSVRTAPFHGAKTGSIPVPATEEILAEQGFPSKKDISRASCRARDSILEEFKQQFVNMQTRTHYRPAQLYNAGGDLSKEWYVEYYCHNPETGKLHRIKERFNINRIHTKSERLAYGKEMVRFLNEKLRQGFSPFKDLAKQKFGNNHHIQAQLYRIIIELGEDGTYNSRASFTEQYNRFVRYIDYFELNSMLMEHINIQHAKDYRSHLRKEGLSRKTINAALSYLTKFWAIAIEKNWASQNPFISVPRVKKYQVIDTEKDTRFEPLSSDEMKKVFRGLLETDEKNFVRYLGMIYYAWARPAEISRLRINDVDFERDLIRFRKNETKNTLAAFVQIVPPLKKLLLGMNLQEYDCNDLLFGIGFKPGKIKQRKNYSSEYWRMRVKKEIGVNKDMYALKHTGNIEYLLRNKGRIDLKWQQTQNRHSSSGMTERYNRKLGAYFIDLKDMEFRNFED